MLYVHMYRVNKKRDVEQAEREVIEIEILDASEIR